MGPGTTTCFAGRCWSLPARGISNLPTQKEMGKSKLGLTFKEGLQTNSVSILWHNTQTCMGTFTKGPNRVYGDQSPPGGLNCSLVSTPKHNRGLSCFWYLLPVAWITGGAISLWRKKGLLIKEIFPSLVVLSSSFSICIPAKGCVDVPMLDPKRTTHKSKKSSHPPDCQKNMFDLNQIFTTLQWTENGTVWDRSKMGWLPDVRCAKWRLENKPSSHFYVLFDFVRKKIKD